MSASIVSQLVAKDYRLMRRVIATFAFVGAVCIAILYLVRGHVPNWVIFNGGLAMLLGPMGTCGIVVLIKTNVFEREKATQPFILSLPVTVKEFTRAKLLVNLPIFAVFWAVVTAAGFYFAFGEGLLPLGAIPFVTMVFLGVFVAYACILSTSLLTQSLGITILGITLFEMASSAYLTGIAWLAPIAQYIQGPVPVWNTAAIAIVAAQVCVIAAVLTVTALIQSTKRDFI